MGWHHLSTRYKFIFLNHNWKASMFNMTFHAISLHFAWTEILYVRITHTIVSVWWHTQHHRNDCYSVNNFRESKRINRHCALACPATLTLTISLAFAPQKCTLLCYWMMFQFTSCTFYMSEAKKALFYTVYVGTFDRLSFGLEYFVQFKILFQSQSIKINRQSRLARVNLFTVTINSIALFYIHILNVSSNGRCHAMLL